MTCERPRVLEERIGVAADELCLVAALATNKLCSDHIDGATQAGDYDHENHSFIDQDLCTLHCLVKAAS